MNEESIEYDVMTDQEYDQYLDDILGEHDGWNDHAEGANQPTHPDELIDDEEPTQLYIRYAYTEGVDDLPF